MTIDEAAKKWNIKYSTVLDYIYKGYIMGITVENDQIIIPDIPKPYLSKGNKKVDSIDKAIIHSLNNFLYTNAKLLSIDQSRFEERLIALCKQGKIFPKKDSPSLLNNLDFAITGKNDARIFNLNINLDPTVNVSNQFGLANLKL